MGDLCIFVEFYRRDDILDIEVSASGFTRQMEKDLLASMGVADEEDEDSSETEESNPKGTEDDIETLRRNVDDIMLECQSERNSLLENVEEKSLENDEKITRTSKFVLNQSDLENKPADYYPDVINHKDNMSDDDKLSAIYSLRSVSTTSTIPPEVS